MRELSIEEIKMVEGGVAPILGGIIAAIGHFGARSFVSSLAGRAGLGLAVYEAAKQFDDN